MRKAVENLVSSVLVCISKNIPLETTGVPEYIEVLCLKYRNLLCDYTRETVSSFYCEDLLRFNREWFLLGIFFGEEDSEINVAKRLINGEYDGLIEDVFKEKLASYSGYIKSLVEYCKNSGRYDLIYTDALTQTENAIKTYIDDMLFKKDVYSEISDKLRTLKNNNPLVYTNVVNSLSKEYGFNVNGVITDNDTLSFIKSQRGFFCIPQSLACELYQDYNKEHKDFRFTYKDEQISYGILNCFHREDYVMYLRVKKDKEFYVLIKDCKQSLKDNIVSEIENK